MGAPRLTVGAVVAALLLGLAGHTTAVAKAPSPKAQIKRAFAAQIAQTKRTPRRFVSKRNRAKLVRTLKKARNQSRKRPCRSLRTLRRYNKLLKRVKSRKLRSRRPTDASPRIRLRAGLLTLRTALLQSPRAKRCGGGHASRVRVAHAKVLKTSKRRLKLRVRLPAPHFAPKQVNGKAFVQMDMDGMGTSGDVGDPGIPAVTSYFGIPQGGHVHLEVGNVQGYTVGGVELYPRQKEPVDAVKPPTPKPPIDDFLEPPFKIDGKLYRRNRPFPSSPADAGRLGMMRDVAVGGVSTSGGQYNPKKNRLRVLTSVDVTVDFGKSSGLFGPATLKDDWNDAFRDDYRALTNLDTLLANLRPVDPRFCGEELLIITSSELRPAADTLAAQRRAQGFVTSVREVGSGASQIGTTPAQIQAFIRSHLNNAACLLRPSYVILFGNTAQVPTFLVPCSPGGDPDACNIASDLDYSLNGIGSDLFADVQLGRLPAPSLDAANALVAKLNAYATSSPAPPGDDFFHHATVTSYFQPAYKCVLNEGESGTPNCDGDTPNAHWEIDYANHQDTRGFTITSERIRNAIAHDGYEADRLFTTDDEDVIPETYWNGTPIPAHLRRPAFAWDANTTDFFNAYNQGRFVILHRDHGWPDGWAAPTLHSGHVPFFTNGTKTPVVFGVNCASAAFDTPDHPSFVELQLLRPDGGAIAGFGDTRVSPSFPNNHMALGFFDAMFPSTVPGYGGPETRRLGDVLVRGKQYMATQEGFEWHGSGDTYVEHYLYHLLGDPTMQMWSDPPERFDPRRISAVYKQVKPVQPGDPGFQVLIHFPTGGGEPPAAGTVVTLFSGNAAIGRGIVGRDGALTLTPNVNGNAHNLHLSYNQDGALPVQDSVQSTPPREKTTLSFDDPGSPSATNNPNPFSGHLDPVLAGAKVRVVYTPHDPANATGTVKHTVTTDTNGDWHDTVNFVYDNSDTAWSARAFFDGDLDHAASASNTVNFNVGD